MNNSFKKVGVATGMLLLATAIAPSFGSSNTMLQSFGAMEVEASAQTTYSTTANLNLRSGASAKHKVLVTIPKGKAVTYVSKSGSWFKVKYGSKTGYVSSAYIKQTTPKSTVVKASSTVVEKYTTKANLNLRSGASVKHNVLATIPKNKEVTYVSKSGSWFKVKYGSKTGYVSSSYLTKVAVKPVVKPVAKPVAKPTPTAPPTAPPKPVVTPVVKPTTATTTTYTTTAGLNLRTGASVQHKVLLTIPKGKAVTFVSKSGSWSKVKYGSTTGFVSTQYLKVTTVAVKPVATPTPKPVPTPTPTPKPVPVPVPVPTPVPVPVPTPVPVPVPTPVPVPVPVPTAPPVVESNVEYVTTANLNMRSGGSVSYGVITSIPNGHVVKFIEKASTGWYQVSYNGKTGYVSPSYLKLNTKEEHNATEVYNTTKYPISLSEMVAKQFSLNAQTDSYRTHSAYVHKSSVKRDNGTDKTISSTKILSAENLNSHVFGTVGANKNITILGESKDYYKVSYQTWRNAKIADIQPNVDPAKFAKGSAQYFQFLDLSVSANVTATELNKVLNGKGILSGQGNAFVEAGKQHGVNELYLVSHALLETGQGNSTLAKGVLVSSVGGKAVTPKVVYNMFGISAFDASALKSGSERAYQEGWTTPEKSIIGGAKFIGNMYVNHPTYKQNTLYKMRWNPARPGTHQYATDIGWAVKQTTAISNLYKALDDYTLTFDVPEYR